MPFSFGTINNISPGQEGHWVRYALASANPSTGLFLFTQYNKSYSMFVLNFKILGPVVPEKLLTEKEVYTHTSKHIDIHRNIVTEKTRAYIPYILCQAISQGEKEKRRGMERNGIDGKKVPAPEFVSSETKPFKPPLTGPDKANPPKVSEDRCSQYLGKI